MSRLQKSARGSGQRRVEFDHPIATVQPVSTTTGTFGDPPPQPLEAACAVSAEYIRTLHIGLQPFLMTLTESCLTAYSLYYAYNAKSNEMRLHPVQIPPAVKKLKLILQPLDEVRMSEGFQALQSNLDTEMETLHRSLTDNYVKKLNVMNTEAHLKRFHFAVCRLLRSAAKVFIAQLNIIDYNVDTAIIDLIAPTPTDLLSSPLPMDATSLLRLYKDAHEEISQLPFPTKHDEKYGDIIKGINATQALPINNLEIQVNNTTGTGKEGQSPSSSLTSLHDTSEIIPNRVSNNRVSNTTTATPGTNVRHDSTTQNTSHFVENQLGNTDFYTVTPSIDTRHDATSIINPYAARKEPSLPSTGSHTQNANELPPRLTTTGMTARPTGPPPPPDSFALDDTLGANLIENSLPYSPIAADERTNLQFDSVCLNLTSDSTEITDHDIHSLDQAVKHDQLLKMIIKLYVNAVKNPIRKFHSIVTTREELQRIKQVTTPILQTCLTKKVAATIQAERPADRPALAGLIRDETEKSTNLLRKQLKSATDKLESIQKQHSLLLHNHRYVTNSQQKHRSQRHQKNSRGGNSNNSNKRLDISTGNDRSAVAASRSNDRSTAAVAHSTSVPTPPSPVLNQPPSQEWGRKRSLNKPQDSAEAPENANAVRRRKNNSSWQRN